MKKFATFISLIIACITSAAAQQAATEPGAQDSGVLQQRIQELEERVIALEGKLRMLEAAQATPPATPATPPEGAAPPAAARTPEAQSVAAGSAPGQLPVYGGATAAAKALNPDISLVGDFIGSAGKNSAPLLAPQQPFSSLQMSESELGLQAIIDPYARGDVFLSFGEEGVELEEGYITFTALPQSLVAKVGKMRSAFGKVNTLHNHTLPWVDRPLVIANLVGGEEGITDAGFSLQRIIPAPKGLFLEATGQLFRGDSGADENPVFRASERGDVSAVVHLRAYKDITESTNLDLGFSYARGHNDLGTDFLTHVYGVDATLRWKPLRRAIYHSFIARSEFVWSQRQQLPSEQRAFGFYTSGDYQLGRRWFLGGRYDWSERSQFANLADKGGSVVLTYWPSEFSQIRGQYRLTNYAEGIKANEFLMQVLFSLGAHGAHPF